MTQVLMNPSGNHPLVQRLANLRGRVRLAVGLWGVGLIVASALGMLAILIIADYLIHIPGWMRLLLMLGWAGGVAYLVVKMLVKPLRLPLTELFLAGRVEEINRTFMDDLASAVQFVQSGQINQSPLAAHHVNRMGDKMDSMNFAGAVDYRGPMRSLGAMIAVLAVVGIAAGMNGNLAKIGASRWLSPVGMDWPRITHVSLIWGTPDNEAPTVLPVGEQVIVRAKVITGGYANQRVWLTTWMDGRQGETTLMTYQASLSKGAGKNDGYVYERVVDPQAEHTIALKVEAGDDNEQSPLEIRLSPRPNVSELAASVAPPSYVVKYGGSPKPIVSDLLTQTARAVEGSEVTIRVHSSKGFSKGADGKPILGFVDANELPLTFAMERTLVEPTIAEVKFTATKTLAARVVMRDADQFENRTGGSFTLEVVPDGLPSVVITDPRRLVERTPTGHIDLTVQATDDLGLDGLKLVADKFDAKPGDPHAFEQAIDWTDRSIDAAAGVSNGRATYSWNLDALKLAPGTRFSFYVMVQDNYESAAPELKRHPWVKSSALTLQVRTEAEIAETRRRELNEVKERIKTLRDQQERTRTQTETLTKAIAMSDAPTTGQRDQLMTLARQESEESATARGIEQRTAQINDDLKQNQMGDSDLGKLATNVQQGLHNLSEQTMPTAAQSLSHGHDAAQSGDKQATSDAAQEGGKKEAEAVAAMDDLIDQLQAAGEFAHIKDMVKQIQEAQNRIDKNTKDLAAQTVGKTLDQLPQKTKDALAKAASDQKDLSARTSDVLSQMQKAAEQMKNSDPAASQSLAKSAEAGKTGQASPSQNSAGQSMSQNQMSSAQSSQQQADKALDEMMNELNKKEDRQQDELAKQIDELLERLQFIRKNQDALNTDTKVAANSDVINKLATQQGQLQVNTDQVKKKADAIKEAKAAAADISTASTNMSDASAALFAQKQPAAAPPQTTALASIDAAIKKLQELKDKMDASKKDKQLAEIIAKYVKIQTGQTTVKTSADAIGKRVETSPTKQVDRMGLVELSKLAKTQGELDDGIKVLSTDEDLKEFEVVIWMNEQISKAMETSQQMMKKAQLSKQTAALQQTALDRIKDVIEALKEEQARKSDKKGGSPPPGGGPPGPGKKPPLVPPLAQLKLLKAMQSLINAQTVATQEELAATQDPAEKASLEAQVGDLGEKQAKVHGIAVNMIKKMSEH